MQIVHQNVLNCWCDVNGVETTRLSGRGPHTSGHTYMCELNLVGDIPPSVQAFRHKSRTLTQRITLTEDIAVQ